MTLIIKFLGQTIDTILNWKHSISDLKPRLNKACYAIGSIKPFMSLAVLKSTYYLYANSIMSYGLIFWGNSTDSDDIFKIQNRIIRIIMNSNKNASCRELFKKLNFLPLQSQYFFFILFIYFICTSKGSIFKQPEYFLLSDTASHLISPERSETQMLEPNCS